MADTATGRLALCCFDRTHRRLEIRKKNSTDEHLFTFQTLCDHPLIAAATRREKTTNVDVGVVVLLGALNPAVAGSRGGGGGVMGREQRSDTHTRAE